MELGCGVGLPTIVALARGATVLATDHYEAALDFTAHNARANLGREPHTKLLDWRAPDIEGVGTFDLVLAADVLYERKNAAALAGLVPKLLAPGGEGVFADPRRDGAPVFLEPMEEQGFEDGIENATVVQGAKEVRVLVHRLRTRRQVPTTSKGPSTGDGPGRGFGVSPYEKRAGVSGAG